MKLKDVWFLTNYEVVYTYVRQNYGSRLDRIYVKDLHSNVINAENIPISWSDHSVVKTKIKMNGNVSIGKGYWKLNCKILSNSLVYDNFANFWNTVRLRYNEMSVWSWWKFAKEQVRQYFMKASRIINQEKFGLLDLLKSVLRNKYCSHSVMCNKFEEITLLKDRIKVLEDEICEGVAVRAKVDEVTKGSRYKTC